MIDLNLLLFRSEPSHQSVHVPRGIIYRITNTVLGRVYIGKATKRFVDRYRRGEWWKHTHNHELKADYEQYGAQAFEVDILIEGCTAQELLELEPFLIWSHQCLHPRGYNHFLFSRKTHVSDVTRQRMSEAHKGKHHSEESKAQISRVQRGHHRLAGIPKTPEHCRRISEGLRRSMTEERRRQRSERQLGGKHRAARPVEQLDRQSGAVIRRYASIADACRAIGAEDTDIIRVCRGRNRTAKGFKWRYAS